MELPESLEAEIRERLGLTPDNLNSIMERTMRIVHECAKEVESGDLMPRVELFRPDGSHDFYMLADFDPGSKMMMEVGARAGVEACKEKPTNTPMLAIMSFTAWRGKLGEGEERQPGPVESWPDRTEIVVIAARTLDGQTAVASFSTGRESEDDPMQPGEIEWEHRFGGDLPAPRLKHLDQFWGGFALAHVPSISKRAREALDRLGERTKNDPPLN